MKSLAAVLAVSLALGGCHNRTKNTYLRYTGLIGAVAGGSLVATYYLNGENSADPNDPKGFDIRIPGAALFLAGAALVVGTYIVKPREDPAEIAARKQREITLQADKLLHEAEAAAAKDDCPSVVALAPKIEALDPGVAAVLKSNVAAARCLAAPATPPTPADEPVAEPAP